LPELNPDPYSTQPQLPTQDLQPSPAQISRVGGRPTIPDNWKSPTLKQLNQENPEYHDLADDWIKMSLLYEGGHAIRKVCTQFLQRRPRELQEVYQARVDRFTYHNIIGTAFGWYRATLFKNPPTIQMGIVDDKGQASGKIAEDIDAWYIKFRSNCDRKNGQFVDIMREVWTSLALYRVAYLLIDVPTSIAGTAPQTRQAQRKAGIIDDSGKPAPYLVSYSPVSVINYQLDAFGNLDWAVIAIQDNQVGFVLDPLKLVDTWYYFDREKFAKWERVRKPNETSMTKIDQGEHATLVDYGYHALRKANMCPLLKFQVPDGLWLANRAYLPTIDHLNQDNSYAWALYMANLAMPVIIGDYEYKPQLSETGAICLPEGCKFEWTEPEGKSFFHAGARVRELREEIYRAMYLMYQGRQATATGDGASGYSKEMDMMPALDVMNEYGDVIIQAMQLTLNAVAQARGDVNVRADVRGMSFGKNTTLEEIEKAEAMLSIGVPSDTFEKECLIQVAASYLPDANAEKMEKIVQEIEAAPNQAARAAAIAEQRQEQFSNSLTNSITSFNTPPNPSVPPRRRRQRSLALTGGGDVGAASTD
jgi:hypothetical protein